MRRNERAIRPFPGSERPFAGRQTWRDAWLNALGLAAVVALVACADGSLHAPRSGAPVAWQATHGREDPRAGRIFDVVRADWIEERGLFDALAQADFVLLGERHDHPDHHRLQARVVRALVARGRRPAVAFEMLSADDTKAVDGFSSGTGSEDPAVRAEALREAVGWDESGWPDWTLYAPVFEAVLAAGLPVVPANLARAEVLSIRRGGVDALPPARRSELGLDEAVDPRTFRALAAQIRKAHCGHAPEAALARMVDVQRAWNAQLAASLAVAAEATHADGGAILIAGQEHVRRDRGAPRRLARLVPDARIATVGFVELDPRDPDAVPDSSMPFDYVWLTPRLDLEDPCEKYRDALETLH